MTNTEVFLTILAIAGGTLFTRALPFLIFPAERETPPFVKRLQTLLPCAVIGLLVVYCLKDVSLFTGSRGAPEFLAIAATVLFHLWKKNALISVAAGTVSYMLLVQYVFA